VGARDDYNWMHLKDFLKSTLSLDQEDVFHVDVMDSFSFFNTPNSQRDKVLETFTDFQLNGRYINVEVSEKAPRGGGGGRGKRKKNSGGGKRSDRRKFNHSDGGFDQGKKKRRKANGGKPSGFGRRSRR
ncbi:MAG: DbpA RNA binding domain-containing protein, partial [Flavobacteriaceae bacterium]